MGYAVSAPAAYGHGGYIDSGLDYARNSYPAYAPHSMSRRRSNPWYDDNYDYGESYRDYDDPYSHTLGRSIMPSNAMVPAAPPMRQRRASFVTPVNNRDMYSQYRHGGRPGSMSIKFKRKGSFVAGIGLDEAQSHVRLSNNDGYSLYDLHADSRGSILLKVKWMGHSSLTYEIPLDAYDGRVNLSTLARRVSRACVHYLQSNVIPVVWERVELHHLEEISYGIWQPMLSTR
ncbi:hypothetical protein Agabi119p4_4698 [Agaricus bisporus var. burnettii]|uniref:DUF6741 domain-containing protein n=1 Tax=Agaricus bisporus var. burnettii TaxID=192524 RepID=A0A8H7F3W7_AGABI|nr:hypothetical protein Agabi119p4_4698 [Agaricus bisporus var. burnettii]